MLALRLLNFYGVNYSGTVKTYLHTGGGRQFRYTVTNLVTCARAARAKTTSGFRYCEQTYLCPRHVMLMDASDWRERERKKKASNLEKKSAPFLYKVSVFYSVCRRSMFPINTDL